MRQGEPVRWSRIRVINATTRVRPALGSRGSSHKQGARCSLIEGDQTRLRLRAQAVDPDQNEREAAIL
jgi:hypothetical protein